MQQALMEAKSVEQPHRLTLDSRSRLSVTGVLEVESFDETEILLTSTRGPLSIRGQGLRLQQLSIDGGQFRLYLFLAVGLTAILYFLTLSPAVVRLFQALFSLLGRFVQVILTTARFFLKFLKKILKTLFAR